MRFIKRNFNTILFIGMLGVMTACMPTAFDRHFEVQDAKLENWKESTAPQQSLEYIELFYYTVTKVEGGEYYGENSKGEGIYFTAEFVKEKIEVGDKVTAIFDANNIVDGLLAVQLTEGEF